VIRSDAVKVNGLSSERVIADIQTQQKVLRVMSYFIEKDQKVFIFNGVSPSGVYPKYETIFDSTMRQFKELSDPKKINVKPDRIRVYATRAPDTLGNTLRSFGVPNEKLKEMALLNGGDLNQAIPANALIKVVEKGR
jgi:predicted Zn-dependent protease